MPHSELYRDGVKWPSVSEVLGCLDKPFLVPWASRHGLTKLQLVLDALKLDKEKALAAISDKALEEAKLERSKFWLDHNGVRDTAAGRGTSYHEDLEKFLVGHMGGDDTPTSPLTEALTYWLATNAFRVVASEKKLIHNDLKYHGTCDAIAKYTNGNQRSIVDFKFTGQISDMVPLQLAGYSQIEHKPEETAWGHCVRFYELAKPAKATERKELKHSARYTVKGNTWAIEEAVYPNLRELYEIFNALRQQIYPYLRG